MTDGPAGGTMLRRQSSCTRSARSRCPPAAGLPYLRASPQPLRRMLSKGARPHPSPSQTSPLTITPRAHPTPRAPLRFLSLAPAPRARKREEGGGRSESERERERERAREGARERETPPLPHTAPNRPPQLPTSTTLLTFDAGPYDAGGRSDVGEQLHPPASNAPMPTQS